MRKQTTATRFIRISEVLDHVGVSRPTIYQWMREGTFPKQITISTNSVDWLASAPSGWKTARYPDAPPPTGGGHKCQQTFPKAEYSSVLCLLLCLPEIVCGAKSFKAFPFV